MSGDGWDVQNQAVRIAAEAGFHLRREDVDAVRDAYPAGLLAWEARVLQHDPWGSLEGGDLDDVTQWILQPLWRSGSIQEARQRANGLVVEILVGELERQRGVSAQLDF